MTAIRLVSTRKIENGDLRALIGVGDIMAAQMSKAGRFDIVEVWQSCVVGIRDSRDWLTALLFVGDSMAAQLSAMDLIVGPGTAAAWNNTVKRIKK